mgnify:CR=1 FL=1
MDPLTDGIKKLMLAGIGAAATSSEKAQEILAELVKKGELTVEQGKVLNTELRHTVEERVNKSKEESSDSAADTARRFASDTAKQAAAGAVDLVDFVGKLSAEELQKLKEAIAARTENTENTADGTDTDAGAKEE